MFPAAARSNVAVMPPGAGEGGTELAPGGVAIELVGGPLDGQIHYMPDARPEWHFPPLTADVHLGERPAWAPAKPLQPQTYRRRPGQLDQHKCDDVDALPIALKYDLVIPAESQD
jgi:hypothetical protein